MMVVEKVSPFKNGHLLVSMLDFWVEFKETSSLFWNMISDASHLGAPGFYKPWNFSGNKPYKTLGILVESVNFGGG